MSIELIEKAVISILKSLADPEILTEIYATHVFVFDNFFGGAAHEYVSVVQDIRAIHNL